MNKFNIHAHNALLTYIQKNIDIYTNIHNILKSLTIYFNESDINKVLCVLDIIVPSVNVITYNRKELLDNTPVFIETLRYFDLLLKQSNITHSVSDIVMLKNIIYIYVNYKILYKEYCINKNKIFSVLDLNEMIVIDDEIDCKVPPSVVLNPYYVDYLRKEIVNTIMFNNNFLNPPIKLYESLRFEKIQGKYESDDVILGCLSKNVFLSLKSINSDEGTVIILI